MARRALEGGKEKARRSHGKERRAECLPDISRGANRPPLMMDSDREYY